MKILITGHRGFIGTHLHEALRKAGHEVHGYDLVYGDDIRDRRKLEQLFEMENYQVVCHLAALAGVRRGELYPEEYISTNVIGTKNIVDMCVKFGVMKLISFSSSSVYGTEGEMHWALREEHHTKPQSIYGMTKLMAEQIVNRANLATVIIRPFTVYGDNGRKDQVMMRWIEAIKNKRMVQVYAVNKNDAGNMVRGYTHVSDLIDGVLLLVKAPDKIGTKWHRTYNLGGSQPIALSTLIDIFSKAAKNFSYKYVGRQVGDVSYSQADTSLALIELGWKPKRDFAKAVHKLIKEGLRS